MRRMLIFVAVLLGVGCKIALAQEADVEKLLAKSDPVIQAQIQTIINALQQPRVDPRSNVDAFREVQKLKGLAGDKDELVRQLAIFAATTKSEEDTHVLIAGMILHLLDLKPSVPIRVLAPNLEADNHQLRDFAGIWFAGHDNAGAARPGSPPFEPVNYHDYLEYVEWKVNRKEEVPAGFVKDIYKRSPGRALLVFAYANSHGDVTARLEAIRKSIEGRLSQEARTKIGQQQKAESQARLKVRRDIDLAEHIVSNAIWLNKNKFNERFQTTLPEAMAELEKLAKHKEWWARLYVAEIMRQHPELRQPAVVQQLSSDSNELVKKAAEQIGGKVAKPAGDGESNQTAEKRQNDD